MRLLILLLLGACANHAAQSMVLYSRGDYAGAARAADEGLAKYPKDDDLWGMRIRAALALGDTGGVGGMYTMYVGRRGGDDKELLRDLSVATLGQALASPSARLKIIAIDAIEELEINALADRVAERLGDDDDRVAASAAVAVIHGFHEAPGVADDMMRSENAEARRIAVDGVGKKVGKIALADLEKAGDDVDPHVRAAALHWVGMLKDRDAVELCTKRLHDPDDAVRAAAGSALARIGLGNLAALGKLAVKDKAFAVRLAGLELLAAAPREDELIALVDDPDPLFAVHAAIAVKQRHPELAAKAIERAITAERPDFRGQAATLIVDAVGKTAAVPLARRLAGDKEQGVRVAAARVLGHLGDRETARKILLEVYTLDVDAAAELAELGEPSGFDQLSKWLADRAVPTETRVAAAKAHRTAHHVTFGLLGALTDPSGLVRVEAAAAIAAIAK